jgi:hypothetical protein
MTTRLFSSRTSAARAAWRGLGPRRAAVLAVAGILLIGPVHSAVTAGVVALKALERGRWVVRDLDSGQTRAPVCLGSGMQLVQLEHEGPACPQEIVENNKVTATVQYSCSGRGFGHTHLRVETPRLVRIDTQGLKNGRPFSYRLEAKRVGIC